MGGIFTLLLKESKETGRFGQKFREYLGLWISKAEDYVSLEKVPSWSPKTFLLDRGTLTGYVERLSWGQFEYPVEYSRTWFDTSRSRYVQRMK